MPQNTLASNERESKLAKQNFGQRLKELRQGKNVTQEAVAKELCVRYATYNSWENGHRTPRSMEDWCKLAEYFNVTIDYLIRGSHGPSVYVPLRESEARGISWKLTTDELSDQQLEAVKVFSLLAQGKSDAQISETMKIRASDIDGMLQDVTRDGPVEITALGRDQDLERELTQKYSGRGGLMGARVFPIGETTSLFSVDAEYKTDLTNNRISGNLREEFRRNGILLSSNTTALLRQKSKDWCIYDYDGDNRKIYFVRIDKEDGSKLNVHGETNPVFHKMLVGWGAKKYLLDELKRPFASRISIGIAGGDTLANMFRSIKRGECPHISIVPLCTSPTEVAVGIDPNTIVGDLAYRHRAYIDAFVLPYVSNKVGNTMKDAEGLSQEDLNRRREARCILGIEDPPPEVLAARRVLGKAANVDMAFLGVGALDDAMSYIMGEFFKAAGGMPRDEIVQKGAIGDILYHIVNRNAGIVDTRHDAFLCSIELRVLKDMVSEGRRVVLVTHSGREEISRAAIEARLVNFVIADDVLAKNLIEET